MSDLLERLEQRAAPIEGNPSVGLTYNFPLAWYRRPDGDIVQLQSDPNNRTMYENLGFVLLRPSEAREWETELRPAVILEQKQRARFITEIRKLASRMPQVALTDEDNLELAEKTRDELEDRFKEMCEQVGYKPRMPALKPEPRTAAPDPSIGNGEELASKMARGQGYDPMREARRR